PRIVGGTREVIRRVEVVEEEHAHRRQDPALVGNLRLQHVVERRDPVGGHEQQVLIVHLIEFAHLAAGQVAVVGQGRAHRVSLTANLAALAVLGSSPMMTRYVPYASRPHRAVMQLISDIVVIGWTALWVWIGSAVYTAVAAIAEAGR